MTESENREASVEAREKMSADVTIGRQSRVDSLMESATNIAIGLAISMAANVVFIPLATGHPLSMRSNGALAAIYTVISLVRSYTLRRVFNGRSPWAALKASLR